MKQFQIKGQGLENLVRLDVAMPSPGPSDVLVRMQAASLNYRDLGILGGHYPAPTGVVPLSDGAGIVEAVGSCVSDFAVGDAVVSCFYTNWQDGAATPANHAASLGCEVDGVLQEYAMIPHTGLLHKPASLDFAEAATLPCAALTAWSALFTEGHLRPGQHVLVQGTGGVALFALQLAKIAGAQVTVISSSDEKLERARLLGADHVLNYSQTPQWGAAVRDMTSGRGVDIIIELGGGETLRQSLSCIAMDGRISVIGVLTGIEAQVSIRDMLFGHVHINGITVGHRADFRQMIATIDQHGVKPVIDQRFAFEEAPAAYAALPTGAHMGKLVIDF